MRTFTLFFGWSALLSLIVIAAIVLSISPATQALSTTQAPAPLVGPVAAPVLKWQSGGCTLPYCETGWYASPAVADLDGDNQPEVIWGSYAVVALNGAAAPTPASPDRSTGWPAGP